MTDATVVCAWGARRLRRDPRRFKNRGRWKVALVALAAMTLVGVVSLPAAASQERLYFWGFAGVQQLDILTEDDGLSGSVSNLETGIVGEGALRYRNYYAPLQSIWLESNVRVEQFLDHGERSSERIRTRAGWRTWFSDERQTQLRLRVEHEYKIRDDDWLFNRFRGQAELRHRLDPQNLVFARARIGSRDYNDDSSAGLDHVRVLGEIGHEWTPHEDRTRLRTRVGFETADADADRYDYEGYYLAIDARHPIRPGTEIFARARYAWREYGGPFDAPDLTERRDRRYRATAGVEHFITDHVSLIGEAGWEANRANVDARRYSGFVFRLGLEVEFDIWRSED